MEAHEDVRLEFAAAVEVDATRVARFVQELHGVPADAWCDVRNIWSATRPADKRIHTTAQLSCERRVADFLCGRFATQTRHVSQGELLLVRCRRVCLRIVEGSLPTAASKQRSKSKQHTAASEGDGERSSWEKAEEKRRPAALPRATMVDLLDCLGDQIVDVLEAFQTFAEPSENQMPRLSMLGLVHALGKLSSPNWKVSSNPISPLANADAKSYKKGHKKGSKEQQDALLDQMAVQRLRHLLSQLIAHQAIALSVLPEKNDLPFMVYTDFISCYVAYMNNPSNAPSASHTSSSKMRDTLEPAMMESVFDHNNNAAKPTLRKSRRHTKPSEQSTTDAAFTGMFLGVSELALHDDGRTSQRSESEDRRSGAAATSGQRLRSRGSRSSGLGASKKKSTPSGLGVSVTKRDSIQAVLVVPGEDVYQREKSTLARQQLTSSASRTRPVKQQHGQHLTPSRTLRPSTRQVGSFPDQQREPTLADSHDNNNNNSEDADEPIVEQAGGRVVGRGAPTDDHIRGRAEWETLYGVNQAGRLPTRSRRYLNCSAGSDDVLDPVSIEEFPHDNDDEGDSSLGGLHADRPPSRQCHAFPTHLLDPREFFSPTKHHDTASAISITPWHAEVDDREEDVAVSNGPEEASVGDIKQPTSDLSNQRPPSRYMVKPARGGSSSSTKSSSSPSEEGQGRLPSRRGAAGSRNQPAAHHYHDPKTDGFLEVDESVPPPFRVEISTEASRAQYIPSQHRRTDEERRHGLKSRRSSSFGSRSHLKNLQQQSLHAPLDSEGPSARDADASARNSRVVEPQWFQDLEPAASKRVPEATPAVRKVAATRSSRSIVQPVSLSGGGGAGDSDNNTSTNATQQWFRSLNNPFFVSPAAPTGAAASNSFDDMDAETAIANTPLFAGEDDLMAMTQLTDLHLDDFMGDPYVYNSTSVGLGNAPANITVLGVSAVNGTATKAASAALNTSLGRDFLSLFAQH